MREPWRKKSAAKSGSATKFPFISTKRPRSVPNASNLENIRKGQFEGLLDEVPRKSRSRSRRRRPAPAPTAGATVVGARKFLIAYNINLNTPDIAIAKKIAKNIRFSNGGLRYVKAMGVDLLRAISRKFRST